MTKTLDSASSGITPLEVLVYGHIYMTDVDFVKETKAVVLPPRFQAFSLTLLASYPGVLFVYLAARRCTLSNWLMSFWGPKQQRHVPY